MTRMAMRSRWRRKDCLLSAFSTRSITSRARCSSSNSPSSSSSASARASPSSCANRPDRAFLRLIFAGTPEFAEQALAALQAAGHDIALVMTQPDRPAGRGQRPLESAVKRLAQSQGLRLWQPETLREPGAVERIRDAQADALVVAAYGVLLPPSLLKVGRFGALNIHASLLPRWRGAAPIQRAILAGDRETGVSIMQMDEGLDTGPVLAERRIGIEPQDDAGTLHDKLATLGARLMVETLVELAAGR